MRFIGDTIYSHNDNIWISQTLHESDFPESRILDLIRGFEIIFDSRNFLLERYFIDVTFHLYDVQLWKNRYNFKVGINTINENIYREINK